MTPTPKALAACSLHSFRTMLSKRADWEDLSERAAIMEYDGNLSRERAEMMVMEATWKGKA